jgi:hypothetical protein
LDYFSGLYLGRTAIYPMFSPEVKQTNELMKDHEFRDKVEPLGTKKPLRVASKR